MLDTIVVLHLLYVYNFEQAPSPQAHNILLPVHEFLLSTSKEEMRLYFPKSCGIQYGGLLLHRMECKECTKNNDIFCRLQVQNVSTYKQFYKIRIDSIILLVNYKFKYVNCVFHY